MVMVEGEKGRDLPTNRLRGGGEERKKGKDRQVQPDDDAEVVCV